MFWVNSKNDYLLKKFVNSWQKTDRESFKKLYVFAFKKN